MALIMTGMAQPLDPDPPCAAPSPPRTPLDEGIFRFWAEFVAGQIAGGRSDVGRMLETAMAFFFERSIQVTSEGLTQHRVIAERRHALMAELQRAEEAWLKSPAGEPLPQPYLPSSALLERAEAAGAAAAQAKIWRRDELERYRLQLQQQLAVGEQTAAETTARLMEQRTLVARRLQVLAPQLYGMGTELVRAAGMSAPVGGGGNDLPPVGLASPRIEAAPPSALRRLTLGVWQKLGSLADAARGMATSHRARLPQKQPQSIPVDPRFAEYEALAAQWMRSGEPHVTPRSSTVSRVQPTPDKI